MTNKYNVFVSLLTIFHLRDFLAVFQTKLANGSKDGKYLNIFKPASMATLDTLLQCSLGYKGDVQLVG